MVTPVIAVPRTRPVIPNRRHRVIGWGDVLTAEKVVVVLLGVARMAAHGHDFASAADPDAAISCHVWT